MMNDEIGEQILEELKGIRKENDKSYYVLLLAAMIVVLIILCIMVFAQVLTVPEKVTEAVTSVLSTYNVQVTQ